MELKLNKAKVNHLLGLLEINEREGYYYGNKDYYLKRHNELKTELKLLIASVVVPKSTLSNLDEAIKKAKPNMDKIKDVDKHLDSIK